MPCRFYEFESFRVDVAERRILRDGKPVPLTSKVFDILLALVENSGRTLEKEELMDRVWSDTFVEEGNLNRNISTLRKVLGDTSRRQRFIKTIPKRGYRFTANVREISNENLLVESKTSYKLNVWEEIEERGSISEIVQVLLSRILALKPSRIAFGIALIALMALSLSWMLGRPQASNVSSLSPMQKNENAAALELFERGRALWHTRSGQDLHEATLLLEQAVRRDPEFALARVALADAYVFDFRHWQKSEALAREAMTLDPTLGEPYATIGFIRMFWQWELHEAETFFKTAIELSPNYATAHQWYAVNLLAIGGSGNAALVEMKRALELDPGSPSINADMCQAQYFFRRYDEAITQCERALEIDPNSQNALTYLFEIYNAKGMGSEAVDTFIRMDELTAVRIPPESLEKLRRSFSTGGIRAFWEARVEYLLAYEPFHYRIAQQYARLGKKDAALDHLRLAYESRDFEFFLFLSDPVFDDLEQDTRFSELRIRFLGQKI